MPTKKINLYQFLKFFHCCFHNFLHYLGKNVAGNTYEITEETDLSSTSLRAILDFGLLDMQLQYLAPTDDSITIIYSSSDMTVIDISNAKNQYKMGDLISFNLQYMGALHLLNSDYIEKIVE